MKWLGTIIIFDRGGVTSTADWAEIHNSYVASIQSIDFPKGTGNLTLRRKQKRPDGQWERNGVGYLKNRFLDHMVNIQGWHAESDFKFGKDRVPPGLHLFPSMEPYEQPIASGFGSFDFVTTGPAGIHVAIEWETGNISSSHRSMNKLAIALTTGEIQAGVLIVPSRCLYEHLTDRIGNIEELSGYLPMWKSLELGVERGLLAISVVEHDSLSEDPEFPYLKSGKDGRAREGRAKRKH